MTDSELHTYIGDRVRLALKDGIARTGVLREAQAAPDLLYRLEGEVEVGEALQRRQFKASEVGSIERLE